MTYNTNKSAKKHDFNQHYFRMKTFVTFLFSLISVAALAQSPVNDDCSGLIDLGVVPYCSDPGQYTNVGATASDIDPVLNIPDCFNNGVEQIGRAHV